MFAGLQRGRYESAWIDAGFGKKRRAMSPGTNIDVKFDKLFPTQNRASRRWRIPQNDSAVAAKVNIHARFVLKFANEFRVKLQAGAGEWEKCCGHFTRSSREHTGGGVRRFAAGHAAIDQQHGSRALA